MLKPSFFTKYFLAQLTFCIDTSLHTPYLFGAPAGGAKGCNPPLNSTTQCIATPLIKETDPMLDTLIVILVVAAAFFFFVRSLYHTFTGKKSGCSGGCSQCSANTTCDIPDDKRLRHRTIRT